MPVISPSLQNRIATFNNNQNRSTIPVVSVTTSQKPQEKKKVDFKEGVKLIGEGIVSQTKNLLSAIIKNPTKTLATTAITSAILFALPLIGIPTAVGGSVLTLGFAGFSLFNLAKNIKEAKQNNDKKDYSKAQDSFRKIGNSTFDLALTLPFVPKAVKNISQFTKYGKVGLNSTLIENIKQEKGLNKLKTIYKADKDFKRSYTYQERLDKELTNSGLDEAELQKAKEILAQYNVEDEKIAEITIKRLKQEKGMNVDIPIKKEMLEKGTSGYFSDSKCELTIKDRTLPDLPRDQNTPEKIKIKEVVPEGDRYRCKMVNSKTGEMVADRYIDKDIYDSYITYRSKCKSLDKNADEISTIVHEYEHFIQASKEARLEGAINPGETEQAKSLYNEIIKSQGTIPKGTEEYQLAQAYAQAHKNYNGINAVDYLQNKLEIDARQAESTLHKQSWFEIYNKLNTSNIQQGKPMNNITLTEVQANDITSQTKKSDKV